MEGKLQERKVGELRAMIADVKDVHLLIVKQCRRLRSINDRLSGSVPQAEGPAFKEGISGETVVGDLQQLLNEERSTVEGFEQELERLERWV